MSTPENSVEFTESSPPTMNGTPSMPAPTEEGIDPLATEPVNDFETVTIAI